MTGRAIPNRVCATYGCERPGVHHQDSQPDYSGRTVPLVYCERHATRNSAADASREFLFGPFGEKSAAEEADATRNSAAEPTPEEIWNELGECRLCGTARWPDG